MLRYKGKLHRLTLVFDSRVAICTTLWRCSGSAWITFWFLKPMIYQVWEANSIKPSLITQNIYIWIFSTLIITSSISIFVFLKVLTDVWIVLLSNKRTFFTLFCPWLCVELNNGESVSRELRQSSGELTRGCDRWLSATDKWIHAASITADWRSCLLSVLFLLVG